MNLRLRFNAAEMKTTCILDPFTNFWLGIFQTIYLPQTIEQEQLHVDIIIFIEISLVSDLTLVLDYLVAVISYPNFICLRMYNFFNLDNAKTSTTTAIIAINA